MIDFELGESDGVAGSGTRVHRIDIERAPACVNVLDVGDNWVVRATTIEQLLEQLRPFLPR